MNKEQLKFYQILKKIIPQKLPKGTTMLRIRELQKLYGIIRDRFYGCTFHYNIGCISHFSLTFDDHNVEILCDMLLSNIILTNRYAITKGLNIALHTNLVGYDFVKKLVEYNKEKFKINN